MNGGFRSLVDALQAAQDEHMVKCALKDFGHRCGFDRFAYLQAEGLEIQTFHTYPEQWQQIYLEKCYSTIDPVVTDAKRRADVFSWTAEDWPDRGSSPLRRFRDEAVNHGIRSGVTIPVRGGFGSMLMLTFASANDRVTCRSLLDSRSAVQAVLDVHYRLKIVGAKAAVSPKRMLSPKEHMCVVWASKGKNTDETALLTGMAPRTVQNHLDRAREKLGAKTLPQLIRIVKDYSLL